MNKPANLLENLCSYVKENTTYKLLPFKGGLRIYTNIHTGITLHILTEEDEKLNFFISVKTSSWDFDNGERTDVNDIVSLAFAVMLRLSNSPISLFTFLTALMLTLKHQSR
jgi:hypothetical protein